MLSIEIKPRHVDQLEKHGIVFNDCLFIDIYLDGKNLLDEKSFEDALVVFEQLELSKYQSGSFLIFTCSCGVADDGGWTGVEVRHEADSTKWTIHRDGEIQYVFATADYRSAIEKCRQALMQMEGKKLEPAHVVFPEK